LSKSTGLLRYLTLPVTSLVPMRRMGMQCEMRRIAFPGDTMLFPCRTWETA
jgi:hypothetical protein